MITFKNNIAPDCTPTVLADAAVNLQLRIDLSREETRTRGSYLYSE